MKQQGKKSTCLMTSYRDVLTICFIFKLLHNMLAVSPESVGLMLSKNVTRSAGVKLDVLRPYCLLFKSSFLYRAVSLWNSLPNCVLHARNLPQFKTRVMSHWYAEGTWQASATPSSFFCVFVNCLSKCCLMLDRNKVIYYNILYSILICVLVRAKQAIVATPLPFHALFLQVGYVHNNVGYVQMSCLNKF